MRHYNQSFIFRLRDREKYYLSKIEKALQKIENNTFGISFQVNDDLSLSYGNQQSEQANMGAADVEVEVDSIQMAYSMGGATIKVAETSTDNAL